MDIDDAITEYALFIQLVKNEGTPDITKFSENVLRKHNHMFQTISKLINIVIVLYVTSLPYERGFGAPQIQIKSRYGKSFNFFRGKIQCLCNIVFSQE